MVRLIWTALAASLTLVSCGGTTGPAWAPNAPVANGAFRAPASNACYTSAQQPEWIFKGACKMATLTANGAVVILPKYSGVGMKVSLPKNTAKSSVPITLADATGNKDILPYKGKAFPLYRKAKTTTLIYLVSVAHINKDIPVRASSALVISASASSFPGSSCTLSLLHAGHWYSLPEKASPKNGTVTFSFPGTQIDSIAAGAGYSVIACSA